MYVITGITGQVGGAVGRALLQQGKPVRAVVRDEKKGQTWAARGCEIALAHAFEGAEGVFILPPSEFDPEPCFPEAREVIDAILSAVSRAKPRKIVCLSTIGAQATQTNLLTQRTLLEQALIEQSIPVTFLRPGWFMENCAWDVDGARNDGVVQSFLQPLDRAIPMIATDDIGKLASRLLQGEWTGTRIVELEGPQCVSPNDIAAAFSEVLGKPVRVQAVPRETWASLFVSQGMKNPTPRIRMLDGFNEGWIDFEGSGENIVKGATPLIDVIRKLVAR